MPQFDPRNRRPQLQFAGKPPGVITRVLAVLAAAGLAVIGLMFSVVVFSIVLAVGLIAAGVLWWRTRELRRHLRQAAEAAARGEGPYARPGAGPRAGQDRDGVVIEGEFIREVKPDPSDRKD